MAVIVMETYETMFFTESTRKNLNTANISESIRIRYRLRSNIKQFNITEKFQLKDVAAQPSGIKSFAAGDILVFVETATPKVFILNCGDTIGFTENAVNLAIGDILDIIESLEFTLGKVIPESLVFVEVVGLQIYKTIGISESLGLSEGLTGIAVDFGSDYFDIAGPRCNFDTPLITETPTGSVDGSNESFTLSAIPTDPNTLLVLVDNLRVTNYTLSGQVFTLTVPPNPGNVLLVYYKP